MTKRPTNISLGGLLWVPAPFACSRLFWLEAAYFHYRLSDQRPLIMTGSGPSRWGLGLIESADSPVTVWSGPTASVATRAEWKREDKRGINRGRSKNNRQINSRGVERDEDGMKSDERRRGKPQSFISSWWQEATVTHTRLLWRSGRDGLDLIPLVDLWIMGLFYKLIVRGSRLHGWFGEGD